MKLLIVEDDLLLQEGLTFSHEGYALELAATAKQADLELSDQHGIRQWRQQNIS